MSNYMISDNTLTGIADAIREKTGGSELIKPINMANAILGIGESEASIEWKKVAELPMTYAPDADSYMYLEMPHEPALLIAISGLADSILQSVASVHIFMFNSNGAAALFNQKVSGAGYFGISVVDDWTVRFANYSSNEYYCIIPLPTA